MRKYRLSIEQISDVQDIAEVMLYVLVRAVLGMFVSLVSATTLYLVSLPVVLSIWARTSVDFDVIGIIFASVGSGVSGFLIWLNRDRPARAQYMFLGLTVLFAALGAIIGSMFGGERYNLLGLPGIPILIGIIVGSAFAANALHFLVEGVKALKHPRL